MNKLSSFKKSLTRERKLKIKLPSFTSKKEVASPQKIATTKVKTQSSFLNHLSSHEKELFVKRLSFLLKAGVPILQSLTMIKDQTRSNRQKKIIESLIHGVTNGQSLHAGLQRFRNIFGDFIINVVRVGENTGFLYQNLNYLAEELKKRRLLRRKVIGALIYPLFVALATICITTLLIVFIFPKILPVLRSLNVPLPITTRFIINLSNFLRNDGFYFFGGLIIFGVVISLISRLHSIQLFISNITPSIPIIGQLLQDYQLANISRTLGLLLKSNIKLVEAIKITAETTPNAAYRKMLEKMGENILKGKKVSNQFKDYPRFFPILIPQMLSVGEITGNLSGSLIYLAEFYETEVDEITKDLSNTLEPLLMILMGAIVGFVAISIITPIYGITQHLQIK